MWYVDVLESVTGNTVNVGDVIGIAQDLSARYPGITNHVHVRMHDSENNSLNPLGY